MFLQLMDSAISTWTTRIANAIDDLLVPILIIACSVGAIWAIVIGIKMMKAEDKNAREENKAKLINIAISIVAIIVLIGLFYALRAWLNTEGNDDALKNDLFGDNKDDALDKETSFIGGNLMNTLSLAKQCISLVF